MSAEQIVALALAIAAVVSGGTYGGVRMTKSKQAPQPDERTSESVLLDRISELEVALADERKLSAALNAQVQRLSEERRELASRVSHLEGQVQTLSNLVSKLVEKN